MLISFFVNRERIHEITGQNETERKFVQAMEGTGLGVFPGGCIECDPPVENKNGKEVKSKTSPDFRVIDEESGREMYVEVTKGNGDTPHKEAQQRVVDQAGVNNYIQLTGCEVDSLMLAESPEEVRRMVFEWFGWEEY